MADAEDQDAEHDSRSNTRPRRGRPPNRDRKAVVEQLIDATESLLREVSYGALTEKKIAAAAGVHERMIHYYFGEKDNLLFEVIARQCDRVLARLHSLDTERASAETVTRALIDNLVEAYYSRPWIVSAALSEIAKGNTVITQNFIRRYGRQGMGVTHLRQQFNALIQRGVFSPDISSEDVALSMIFLVVAPFVLALLSGRTDDGTLDRFLAPRWLEHIADLFDRQLRAKPLRAGRD